MIISVIISLTVLVDPSATLVSLSVLLSVADQMISCKLLDNAVATVGQPAADLPSNSSQLQTNVDHAFDKELPEKDSIQLYY